MKHKQYLLFVFILFFSCEKNNYSDLPLTIKRLNINDEEYNIHNYYQFSYTNGKLSHVTEYLSNVPFNSNSTIHYELSYNNDGNLESYTTSSSDPEVEEFTSYLKYRSNQILYYFDNHNYLEGDTLYYKLLNNKIIESELFHNYRIMPGDDGFEFILREKCQFFYENNNLIKTEELFLDNYGDSVGWRTFVFSYDTLNNPFYYSLDLSIFFMKALKFLEIYSTPLSENNFLTRNFYNGSSSKIIFKYNRYGYPIEMIFKYRTTETDSATTILTFYY
jgi:hypothetical protein